MRRAARPDEPDAMAARDRVAEIGEILAVGYRRVAARQNPAEVDLAVEAAGVALCRAPESGLPPAGKEPT
jgi:hypothetical protein